MVVGTRVCWLSVPPVPRIRQDSHHEPTGFLQPLPVHSRPVSDIALDFVTLFRGSHTDPYCDWLSDPIHKTCNSDRVSRGSETGAWYVHFPNEGGLKLGSVVPWSDLGLPPSGHQSNSQMDESRDGVMSSLIHCSESSVWARKQIRVNVAPNSHLSSLTVIFAFYCVSGFQMVLFRVLERASMCLVLTQSTPLYSDG